MGYRQGIVVHPDGSKRPSHRPDKHIVIGDQKKRPVLFLQKIGDYLIINRSCIFAYQFMRHKNLKMNDRNQEVASA
jgi:hypothetical protein